MVDFKLMVLTPCCYLLQMKQVIAVSKAIGDIFTCVRNYIQRVCRVCVGWEMKIPNSNNGSYALVQKYEYDLIQKYLYRNARKILAMLQI